MKKMKRLLAVILVLAMAVASLSACGSSNDDSNSAASNDAGQNQVTDAAGTGDAGTQEDTGFSVIPKDTVTLTVYSQLANYSGEQIGWFAKILLDKFNVKMNIVPDDDGVYETRMESGNLGDIVIWGADTDDYINAVESGMLFCWDDEDLLHNYGPYIEENMELALKKNRGLTESGKLYGYGHGVATDYTNHESYFYHPDIRWDLYAQLGYPEVGTLEDLVDLLKKMKEICPLSDDGKETYGVSMFDDWDGTMVMMVKSTAALYGWEEFGVGLYDAQNQVFQGCLEEGGMYLRCLKFYNDLYQNDLLDPDSLTQKYEGTSEDYQNGRAFFNIFNFIASASYNTPEHIAAGKAMYTLPLKDQVTLCTGLNVNGGNRVWSIGSKTQYPELCMTIINWLATPEGRMTMEYGPQGVTWDYDENKAPFLTELGLACKADKETEMKDGYTGTFGDGTAQMNNISWSIDAVNPDSDGSTYNYLFWDSYNLTQNSDIMNDWRNHTGFVTQDEYLDSLPHIATIGTSYSDSQKSTELKLVWEQVITCIKNYSWKAIYAETDEEYDQIVNQMITEAKAYGYDQCVEFTQADAERRKALEDEVKAGSAN